MRGIWKEYGRTLLYVLVAAALILLTVVMIGKKWREADTSKFETDYAGAGGNEQDADETQLEMIVSREAPGITYLSDHRLFVGQEQPLEASFRAEDADGEKIAVEIMDVRNAQGDSCSYPFTEAGIYQIKVKAEDRLHKRTQLVFRVPVNRGDI